MLVSIGAHWHFPDACQQRDYRRGLSCGLLNGFLVGDSEATNDFFDGFKEATTVWTLPNSLRHHSKTEVLSGRQLNRFDDRLSVVSDSSNFPHALYFLGTIDVQWIGDVLKSYVDQPK